MPNCSTSLDMAVLVEQVREKERKAEDAGGANYFDYFAGDCDKETSA